MLALLCALSPAIAADAVEIAAAVGFDGAFRPGRWTPLSVTVTNQGGDLGGELEVQVAGGDELVGGLFVTTHRRRLELSRGSRKRLQFTVLPQSLARPLVIRVRAGGRELAREEIELRSRYAAGRLLLVLSRDADLDYLNDDSADGLRVAYPHPELLPVHWRGYDAVAAMVLHGVSLERLSAGQFEALHKWIAQGGILAVSGGPDYALLRSPRLAALLPALPLGMTRIDADALRRAFSASLDASRPVHVNRLGKFRGQVRLRADDAALIVERALGLGRVLYLTFDVANYPFDRWGGMRELWRESLRLPPPASATPGAAQPARDSPVPALIRAQATNFPRNVTVFLFMTLYLGLLLAGYRLPVRGTRLRWLAPLATWAAPLIFAPAAWLLFGPAVFPRNPAAVQVAVIEPFPGSSYARLALDVGVYASRSGALRLEYGGAEPVLQPSRQAQRRGQAEDWVLGEGPLSFIAPRDRRRYVLHALEGEDVIAFRLDASVRDETRGPRIVLDNASGRAVEGLWLVFDGYAYQLGAIADGARLERALDRRADGVEVGEQSWRRVLRTPRGVLLHDEAAARLALERWSVDTGGSGFPGPGSALLVGYTASPFQPARLSGGWPRLERSLVAFRVQALRPGAPAGEPGNGAQESTGVNRGWHGSPRALGAAADAAAQ